MVAAWICVVLNLAAIGIIVWSATDTPSDAYAVDEPPFPLPQYIHSFNNNIQPRDTGNEAVICISRTNAMFHGYTHSAQLDKTAYVSDRQLHAIMPAINNMALSRNAIVKAVIPMDIDLKAISPVAVTPTNAHRWANGLVQFARSVIRFRDESAEQQDPILLYFSGAIDETVYVIGNLSQFLERPVIAFAPLRGEGDVVMDFVLQSRFVCDDMRAIGDKQWWQLGTNVERNDLAKNKEKATTKAEEPEAEDALAKIIVPVGDSSLLVRAYCTVSELNEFQES
jgi:hypothetical protein